MTNEERFKEASKDAKQIGPNIWTNAKRVQVWKCTEMPDGTEVYTPDYVLNLETGKRTPL